MTSPVTFPVHSSSWRFSRRTHSSPEQVSGEPGTMSAMSMIINKLQANAGAGGERQDLRVPGSQPVAQPLAPSRAASFGVEVHGTDVRFRFGQARLP